MTAWVAPPALSRRAFLAGLASVAAASARPARADSPPAIAAASDLRFALQEIAEAFRAESGRDVRLSFGSSGNFARQIRQGAPFELYLSADERFVRDLARDGFTEDAGVLYAVGRIVILVPEGGPLAADGRLDDLAAALEDGRLERFAIANPEHAPYGVAARQALEHKGLWTAIEPRLAIGENVSQTAQFALSGAAQGGLAAYSLALAPQIAGHAAFELVPEDWHAPLRQRMALIAGAGDTARRLYGFLQAAPGRAIMERYGFAPPDGGG